MKKKVNKFTKLLLLTAMILSEFMTPISVLADEINSVTPNKGDVSVGGVISDSAVVSTPSYSTTLNDGEVQVTKTVSKVAGIDGRYQVSFNVKGEEVDNIIEVTKPLYLVVLFDTSNSMLCGEGYVDEVSYNEDYAMADGTKIRCYNSDLFGDYYDSDLLTKDKWESAVSAAVSFSQALDDIDNTYISLVNFGGNASSATDFIHGELNASQFSYLSSGTNIKAGLNEAQAKLDTVTAGDAQKYILIIGDGKPTAGGSYSKSDEDVAKEAANNAKLKGTKIFAIGYGIENDTDAQRVLKYVSSDTVVSVDDRGNIQVSEQNLGYYKSSSTSGITSTLTTVFQELGEPKKAGEDAVITDYIGSAFKIVNEDGSLSDASSILLSVGDIVKEGTTVSFNVQVDESLINTSDWYNVNNGFELNYTDYNGEDTKITYSNTEAQPQVYWKPCVYTVNYYKDSFNTEVIASDVFTATSGTIINQSDVNIDKYLENSSLGTNHYEFNSITGVPVTIEGNDKVINVLYTIKKYNYTVEFYYDGVLDENVITEGPVNYGTSVDSSIYYDDGIREGYSLDTVKSTSGTVVIDSDEEVIKVYYKKNNYGYTVNYYFNNVIDNDFTKSENALYGTIIKAEDNYLGDVLINEKEDKDNKDYFINPIRPSDPNQITIGTNALKNVINIYYVSTVVTDENIDKTADVDTIVSSDTLITYTVDYTSVVSNVKKGDTVKVVITDTLPYAVEENKSDFSGGIYDATSKTITWTFETTMSEFTERYDASKSITYSVVYKDLGISEGGTLTNSVTAATTAGGKTTTLKGDSVDVEVEIPGKVTAVYVDENDSTLADNEIFNGLVGESYTTNTKVIFGYTLKEEPSNKNGIYTEEDITVKYVYTKNDGTLENTDVIKTSSNSSVPSINGIFDYEIKATGKVSDYVGDITIKVVDNLPYELTTDAINNLTRECVYDSASKTITCTRVISVTHEDYVNDVYKIDEVFNLSLSFIGIDSEVVTNNAKVEITLDSNIKEEDADTEDVTVEKGKVTSIYVEDGNENNILSEQEEISGLVGSDYVTSEKQIFGYTLKENPNNKNGVYTKEDITVKYVYTKNAGTLENTDVIKTSSNSSVPSINGIFDYEIKATGEVSDYVGDITIKVVDNLPYELTTDAINNLTSECVYDSTSKTITCTRVISVTHENYVNDVYKIDEVFNLSLSFIEIDSEVVTNNAKVEITLDSSVKEEDADTEDVIVEKGTVVATYKDTDGNILHEEIITSDFGGREYTTEEKSFYGYSLKSIPSNKDGKYLANTTIYVDYVYKKNPVNVSGNEVEKIGPDSISDINNEFNYTFNYKATIREYIGKVTLRLTDTLPFEAIIIEGDNSCHYFDKTIVCEKEYDVNSDTTINEQFNIAIKYNNINFSDISGKVILTNSVKAELIYGDENVINNDSKETELYKGTVVATYKDTDGNILHDDILFTGLAGSLYTTEEKTFFGYTLVKTPENNDGKYVSNSTIYVDYVYDKNDGKIENTEVLKTSSNSSVPSINGIFDYEIKATGEVSDYVGDITIKVVDNLPYELTTNAINNLTSECVYDSTSKTITCTRVISVTHEDYVNDVYKIDEVFNLSLSFIEIDSEVVTNNAKVEITLDSSVKEEDADTEDVTVEKGKVLVTYKDIFGNKLSDNIIMEDLVGKEYTTFEKEFYGYTLIELPENKNGIYTKEDINVDYVYNKNIGTSEEELVKNGLDLVDNISSEFKYVITYNTTIKDYVGEATLVIIDELPYEIDINKSIFSENCKYTEGKLVCSYSKDITKDDNKFNVSEVFSLYYINIDGNFVTNKATSKLTYGDITKENDSEYTSEVNMGSVIVNYVTTDGEKLFDSITLDAPVGSNYITEEKEFDGYSIDRIEGITNGEYIDGTIEVTYVYELALMPPKTGIDINLFIVLRYIVLTAIVLVSGKTYRLLRNN